MNEPTVYVVTLFSSITETTVGNLLSAIYKCLKEGIPRLVLLLASPGGNNPSTFAFCRMVQGLVRAYRLELETWAMSNVSSAAILLYSLGQRRLAVPGSYFQFHDLHISSPEQRITHQDLKHFRQILALDRVHYLHILHENTGLEKRLISRWMRNEVKVDAEKARSVGLVHEIRPFTFPAGGQFLGAA